MERAPLTRRFVATSLDLVVPLAIGVGVAVVIARFSYTPPPGWFWSEWLLKIWLDYPAQLIVPVATAGASLLIWQAVWESLWSRTPGGALLGLEVVDPWGHPIDWPRALRRLAGGLLSFATLGLGWMWAWVDPEGRSLPDRLAGTWVVRERASALGKENRA